MMRVDRERPGDAALRGRSRTTHPSGRATRARSTAVACRQIEENARVVASPVQTSPESAVETTPASQGATLPVPPPEVAASVIATASAVSHGLAAIGAGTTATEVFRAACALAVRLPGVASVGILRQDDRGLFTVAFAPTDAAISARVQESASTTLHQRWIAAHAPGSPVYGPGPFCADGHSDVLIVPFVRADTLLGALVIAGTDGRALGATKAERITASAIGVVTAQVLEAVSLRQRLEWTLTPSEHEAALVAERKRISHDLHDGPTQDLAFVGTILDRLIAHLGDDRLGVEDARQARDVIDRSIHGMRQILTTLRSRDLPMAQWPTATGPLRELLAEMPPGPNSPELEVDFSQVSGVHLTPEVERALVGIVREALHNVRKHADADSVQLEVRRAGHEVEIAVVDDGIGFDGMGRDGHFGLEQIRKLAEGMGGRVEVGSLPSIGTSVRAWIPLPGVAENPGPEEAWADAMELDWAEASTPRSGS